MQRTNDNTFLLFIEPKREQKSVTPVNDMLTEIMELAFKKAIKGSSNYHRPDEPIRFRAGGGKMGVHRTECGEKSTNNEYLLENGMITNSLCIFYLKYYREAIPESEINKVLELIKFYELRTKSND